MTSEEKRSVDFSRGSASPKPTVRFDDAIYTDQDPPFETVEINDDDNIALADRSKPARLRHRRKSGILKRRENTITTADAPPIILSDEGLKAGRVSPFTNFPLFLSMTIRSVGVIFGDIGTSPLYVVKSIFDIPPVEDDVIGAISLIVWSLIVVVSLKYAIFILMADNRGEGGPFALCGILTGQTSRLRYRTKQFVSIVSILAACLLIGDGALTPAVSILSALEGLTVVKPSVEHWTVRISVIIIIFLFLVQRWGSSRIGIIFGPIMILWFLVLAAIGLWRVTQKPVILLAFNPWEAMHYLIRTKTTGFYQIGSVFLAVTGLEALYADLGHFGRWPVRFSWFTLVFPSILLNYLGQGAILILDPDYIDNPFYHAAPGWALWPMLVFSVISTTIASQAIITGSFSLVSQAVSMGFCVPFTVIHTSRSIISHIYVPSVNYFLLALTLAVTIGFQSSDRITDAYGVTVCSLMVITTVLYMMVMRFNWLKPMWLVILFGIFLIIDLYTFAAIISTKIGSGGWVAIIIAFSLFIFSFSWYYGNICLKYYLSQNFKNNKLEDLPARLGLMGFDRVSNEIEQEEISESLSDDDDDEQDPPPHHREHHGTPHNRRRLISDPPDRISISIIENPPSSSIDERMITEESTVKTVGVGCFLTMSKKYTAYVFENFLSRMHAHQEVLIFLKLEYVRMANIDDDQRLLIRVFGRNIYHITAIFGYTETNINLFNILHLARQLYDVPITEDELTITFFIPNDTIEVNTNGWRTWLKRWPLYLYSYLKNLFPGMSINFQSLPENTIRIGISAKL